MQRERRTKMREEKMTLEVKPVKTGEGEGKEKSPEKPLKSRELVARDHYHITRPNRLQQIRKSVNYQEAN